MGELRDRVNRLLWASLTAVALMSGCTDSRECIAGEARVGPTVASGEMVWEQLFTGLSHDAVDGLAVDPCSGDVGVTGRLWTNKWIPEQRNLWVARLDHDGTPRWDHSVHYKWDDYGLAVAFAADGSMIVAGVSQVGRYPGTAVNAGWLARYDPEGRRRWRVRDELEDEQVSFEVLAVDGDRIFVAGGWGSTGSARAYDLDGELQWIHQDDNLSFRFTIGAFVLADGDPLFISNRNKSLILLRLARDGGFLERVLVPELETSTRTVTLTPDQRLLIAHQGSIWEIALDGTIRSEIVLEREAHLGLIRFEVAADGTIYVAGSDLSNDEPQPWVAVFEPDGSLRWSTVVDRSGRARYVAIGPLGDLFAAGYVEAQPAAPDERNHDLWFARFAP